MPNAFSGQVGFKTETTWGTAVAVDKFVGFTSFPLGRQGDPLRDPSIRGNRLIRAFVKNGITDYTGNLELVMPNVTIATLLKHMTGAVVTAGAGPYTHTYTIAGLTGQSMTVQAGRPDASGTVRPFTYPGTKINTWEMSASVGEWVNLTLGLTAKEENLTTAGVYALGSATYAAGYNPFTFIEASVEIPDGTAVPVHNFTLRCNRNLRTDHRHLGSATIGEQYDNGFVELTGSMEMDFTDLTAYNRVVNSTQASLEFTLNNGTDSLVIDMNVLPTGDTPVQTGPENLVQPYNFEVLSATSDAAAFTAVLTNTESSAA